MTSKVALRHWAKATRAALDLPTLSAQLCERFGALPLFQAAQHILLYAGTEEEINLLPLTQAPHKHFYLPRCAPQRRLAIHAYPCPLVISAFGIAEPAASEPEVPPTHLDLVIVPALALTPTGQRLGYGGGYYDRFLPRLAPTCQTIGVIPNALLCENLPGEPWDFPVNFVFTESKFLRAQREHDINLPAVPL